MMQIKIHHADPEEFFKTLESFIRKPSSGDEYNPKEVERFKQLLAGGRGFKVVNPNDSSVKSK